ncbi:hypothetical protein KM043_004022 [Ampulex compressa]|nr:hypothetical protein KM043_004022 [Ampulex compressa]
MFVARGPGAAWATWGTQIGSSEDRIRRSAVKSAGPAGAAEVDRLRGGPASGRIGLSSSISRTDRSAAAFDADDWL